MPTSVAYRTLIEAICREAGIAEAAAVQRDGNLRVGDVDFSLLEVPHAEGELLLIYSDFGVPPAHDRAKALQRLLELNLLMYGGEGPGFSFNRESGHVLLMAQLRLARTTSAAVLTVLRALALFAKRWRAGHFLQDMPDTLVAAPAPHGRAARPTPFVRN